jgi:hypothetical protein
MLLEMMCSVKLLEQNVSIILFPIVPVVDSNNAGGLFN